VSRYRCVDAQKAAGFPVVPACEAAGVGRSSYYAWAASAAQGPSQHERDEVSLVAEIRRIHVRSGGTYGAPRVGAELDRRGWTVNHKRVERLMRTHGIVGYRPRRRRNLTRPDTTAAPAPDLLGRLFDPDQVNVAWCGDVTYIPTDQGWLYVASVIDLASRHLLGWSMGTRHDATLVTDALGAAIATRGGQRMDGTIFHTDRGGEYTSTACIDACTRLGLRRSMGRTGSCLDNAVAESWFASLKVELVDRAHYRTRAEARAAIFRWIAWYNRYRLHSTNHYLPPIEWEQQRSTINPLPSPVAA
jgi:putative transposase